MTAATQPVPGFVPGSLVCYYLDGWRYGHLERVKKTMAVIRPVAAYGGAVRLPVRIPITDLRPL